MDELIRYVVVYLNEKIDIPFLDEEKERLLIQLIIEAVFSFLPLKYTQKNTSI